MAVTANTGSGLGGVAQIIQLLGGTTGTTTTNPGDTTELRNIIGESQTDPEAENALLTAIFQQAAGQIPGLQAAFSNAVGARGGNNSAVTAALSRLLQQTTTSAQQQIIQQRQQAMQTRANAAAAIAQATRGTSTSQRSGTNLGQAGAIIAGLQLFGKVRGMLDDEDGVGGILQRAIGGGGGTTGQLSDGPTSADVPTYDTAAINIDEPAVLPADWDAPIDTTGPEFAIPAGDDVIMPDSSNDDLGGWQDPMMDPNIDWSM